MEKENQTEKSFVVTKQGSLASTGKHMEPSVAGIQFEKSAPEETAKSDHDQQQQLKEQQPNRTEIQLAALDKSKYSVMAYLLTNSSGNVIISLDSEQDYKQGRWHYVPQDIPADLQAEFGGKKYSFEVYCTSDKNSQKRLKKLIRRFMPGVEVVFLPVGGNKFGLDDSEKIVECTNCGNNHQWGERIIEKNNFVTKYMCPECGDESYVNV